LRAFANKCLWGFSGLPTGHLVSIDFFGSRHLIASAVLKISLPPLLQIWSPSIWLIVTRNKLPIHCVVNSNIMLVFVLINDAIGYVRKKRG